MVENGFQEASTHDDGFSITQLIEYFDSMDHLRASIFGVTLATDDFAGTVRSELKVFLTELDEEVAGDDIRYAHSWLSDLWNRADAVSIACGTEGFGLDAHRLRDMSVSLIDLVTRIRDEIENGNGDLAEAYRIELIS